jgi:CheY-like chemotaxis protein
LGSAVIKGQATEVIDVGHFLPMAFADWFSRKEMRPSASAQSVLLVDDSAFFRNMLAPVLKAAGYRVRVATNAQEGLMALRSGQTFDAVLTDIEMPDMNGFCRRQRIHHEAVRQGNRHREIPGSRPDLICVIRRLNGAIGVVVSMVLLERCLVNYEYCVGKYLDPECDATRAAAGNGGR